MPGPGRDRAMSRPPSGRRRCWRWSPYQRAAADASRSSSSSRPRSPSSRCAWSRWARWRSRAGCRARGGRMAHGDRQSSPSRRDDALRRAVARPRPRGARHADAVDTNLRGQLHPDAGARRRASTFSTCAAAKSTPFLEFLAGEAPGATIVEAPMMRGRIVKIGDVAPKTSRPRRTSPGCWKATAASPMRTRRRRARSSSPGNGGTRTIPARRSSRWRRDRRRARAEGRRFRSPSMCSGATSGRDRQSAQGELAQLRDQFRAGLFAEHIRGRAAFAAGDRGVGGRIEPAERDRAAEGDGAAISRRRRPCGCARRWRRSRRWWAN